MTITAKADVVIIGGGVVGTAIARELSKYTAEVVLIEKEPDVAMGTSKANSGILHAGFDAKPGSLKAKTNVRGNLLYREICQDLGMDIKFIGSLVVATSEDEMATLRELLERGRKNDVPGLEILDKETVLKREPNLSENVTGALWAPTGGVMCPFGATIAFANNAVENGAKIYTECSAEEIIVADGKITGVKTSQGFIAAKYVINAAGLFADDLSRSAGDNSFNIKPRKGEYVLFDKTVATLVNTVIFPTPSKVSKGILVSPTAHGNLFIGPNAQDIDDKDDMATTPAGIQEIIAGARKTVPNLPLHASITQFAGLRAAAGGDGDFIIRPSDKVQGLIQAAGIQSPGLTAAPAIAEIVIGILKEQGLNLIEKANFNPKNRHKVKFHELTNEERAKVIAQNPLYGRVVCRCESVTEGEIVDAIHSPCGAVTVDGVKRRTRAGMGRCQGGFCGPRVTAILARELNIPVTEVRKDTTKSYLFYDKISAKSEVQSND